MAHRSSDDYRAAEQRGRTAEQITKWIYRLGGCRCLGQRIKTPFGEIDLCMARGNQLFVLEVKYHKKPELGPESAVPTPKQVRRIRNAISWYVARNANLKDKQIIIRLVQWNSWRHFKQTHISFLF